MYLVSSFPLENGCERAGTPLMSQHYYRTHNKNMDHKYFLPWIFQRGEKMCCVDFISLFKYFSFEFVCACVVRTKKRSRVFIIFIDAIINDWCLFVWAVSALAICMLCACTRENLHFWFLLFDHAQCVEWKNEWQKYCLFAHSSWTTRLDFA